ncbi:hypothetical protein JCM1841_004010 [Sporobolomyces salmonicolor]
MATTSTKQPQPYGSWESPITSDLTLTASVTLAEIAASPNGKAVAWVESRPEEKGRSAIVYQAIGSSDKEEVLPDQKWNARSRVHEYGGGAWTFGPGGESIVFSSFAGPAYKVKKGEKGWGEPDQITPASDVYRYADFDAHPTDPSLTLAVLEDHTHDTPADVVNALVLLSDSSSSPTLHTVASGADFYASPRWSPSGKHVLYTSWMHPDMPWEGSELWVAKVNLDSDGKIDLEKPIVEGSAVKVAGQLKGVESVSQPRWALNEEGKEMVVFLNDRTGFHELYSYTVESAGEPKLLLKEPTGADVGGPDWVFGNATHAPLSSTQWISTAKNGSLRIISLADGTSITLPTRFVSISALKVVSPAQIAVIASPAATPTVVSLLTLPSSPTGEIKEDILKLSSSASVDPGFISTGEKITYPTPDNSTGYAIYYAPSSAKYTGPPGDLPPLVTRCHGGPTGNARQGLDWVVAFFTSRGFAFVDVDYGGSATYGAEYRRRLDGKWGIVDVQDTIACVESLVQGGKVDAKRVSITGGSAGGFTVLAALTDSNVFTAGCSYYGVSDLKALAEDTHKFESQYLFKLVGGTPDQVPQNYHDRSPIHKASRISAPLLLLQGTEDRVVPPSQATSMLDKVKSAGGTCEIVMFEGEGHGFRSRDARKRAMEEELTWLRTTWGLEGGKA